MGGMRKVVELDPNSANQLIDSTHANKKACVATFDALKSEVEKGKRNDFEHYLSMVPDIPAQPGDKAS